MVNPDPLAELLPYIDAANVNVKGFTQRFYDAVGGSLDTVKRTVEAMARSAHCHLEVTTLVVPGMNDSPNEIAADGELQLDAALDPSVPYHVTRFFPCHRLTDRPPTDVRLVHELADVARRHLRHVYVGNC